MEIVNAIFEFIIAGFQIYITIILVMLVAYLLIIRKFFRGTKKSYNNMNEGTFSDRFSRMNEGDLFRF